MVTKYILLMLERERERMHMFFIWNCSGCANVPISSFVIERKSSGLSSFIRIFILFSKYVPEFSSLRFNRG